MKKGFTLIELLAVIVILAIIALIATPIILGIINDAREKANESSVELYGRAVRNAIAAYQLTGKSAPESFDDLNVEKDGDIECATEELYSDGNFYIADCTVNGVAVDYTYGTKIKTICTAKDSTKKSSTERGTEYSCNVDGTNSYTFYVLNSANGKVNLIMDSNVGGTAWHECNATFTTPNSAYGPVTAMEKLKQQTDGWTELDDMTITQFSDENGNLYNFRENLTFTTKARLPHYTELNIQTINGVHPVYNKIIPETDAFLYTNSGRYWTLSSGNSTTAWTVDVTTYNNTTIGYVDFSSSITCNSSTFGIRPVITVSIKNLG